MTEFEKKVEMPVYDSRRETMQTVEVSEAEAKKIGEAISNQTNIEIIYPISNMGEAVKPYVHFRPHVDEHQLKMPA